MQHWQEEYSSHPIHTAIGMLLSAAKQDYPNITPPTAAHKVRFTKIIQRINDILKSADPDLVPIDIITNAYNNIQASGIIDVATRAINDQDAAAFYQLNDILNFIHPNIHPINTILSKKLSSKMDANLASESFEQFSHKIHHRQVHLEDKFSISSSKISDLDEAITNLIAQKIEIERSINEKQKEQEQKFNELISSINEKNNDFVSEKSSQITKIISEYKSSVEEESTNLFESQKDKYKLISDNLQQHSNSIHKQGQDLIEKIRTLYGLAARDSVTGGHKTLADIELRAAKDWRRVTVGSIFLTLGWLVVSLFWIEIPTDDKEFWMKAIKSTSVTSILIAFSIYASRQSSLHRLNEKKARSFFLQIQAFDPFVESLNDELKQKLKVELSSKIFSPEDLSSDRSILENSEFKSQALDIMADLKKLLAKNL